ncbi:MAG: cupin-like domain-containing protein [Myxococcales bacterium]|nr:cupin-like domain-containing protein [Myxococcales bacterium]
MRFNFGISSRQWFVDHFSFRRRIVSTRRAVQLRAHQSGRNPDDVGDAVPSFTVSDFEGPTFQRIRQVEWAELTRSGPIEVPSEPLLVKGALRPWPAYTRWTFEALSELRRPDGSEVVARFANGLDDQGVTRPPLDLPIGPYLAELGDTTGRSAGGWLLSAARLERLDPGTTFHLDWSSMEQFKPDRIYLSQWSILSAFPALREDLAIRALWPGWSRRTWEYVFIGPAETVTGLHYDVPDNWFCQVRGTKEVILFPPGQRRFMCASKKYDWGATLSDIDITRLSEMPRERDRFARATGLYGQVKAGDALFIPRQTWHSMIARSPSISLGVFGLTPWDVVALGGSTGLRALLHQLRLYRWGNCTCHAMTDAFGSPAP